MNETFSSSHEMTKYVNSYWKLGKLLEEQGFNRDMDSYLRKWTESVFKNAFKRESKHKSKGSIIIHP